MTEAPPKHRLPDTPMAPSTAYRLVRDELMPDGDARLNPATFVTTWMEPEAGHLTAECRDKNMIGKDEYPRTAVTVWDTGFRWTAVPSRQHPRKDQVHHHRDRSSRRSVPTPPVSPVGATRICPLRGDSETPPLS